MANVTIAEVKEIITTALVDADITVCITSANLITSEDLANRGLSTARIKEIERWLAAHFVAMKDDAPRVQVTSAGQSSARFGGALGESLSFTRWGQQAMILDSTGTLAGLGTQTARFTVL